MVLTLPSLLLSLLVLPLLSNAASRTSPPSGAIIVRQNTKTTGEFATIQAAVNSLPSDGSNRSIFIYSGTYSEQVYINRTGALALYGYTTDTTTYASNAVTIVHSSSQASGAASDDATGTLRVHKDDFSLYNINVKNSYGQGSQAAALSAYGNRMGLYASSFLGYQDTLYANQGTQVYGKSYIEGAVDFIFGRQGLAYFEGNTISSIGPGCITASGRETNDTGSYVLNRNTLVLGPTALTGTSGKVFLGRPWGAKGNIISHPTIESQYLNSRVVFKNTQIGAQASASWDPCLNPALWSVWSTSDTRTDNVLFATFQNSGPGSSGVTLPSFATALNASAAAEYTIATAVGSDWESWVDTNFVTGE
ncbi:carbohydrate esterase family 8 protein [Sphaerobolus stellatus SS14]|uniref:Pectinesterase n=1 Tax=Sphaerobolus stellatus (strain SS14) TaxID=990650 RepID=A0A0C9V1W6_SPHS4|nr:carbohydrate esterase family 8 protein [Sphaerobolus stellatus SS14]